jgi:ribose transport system substrate-binding protein
MKTPAFRLTAVAVIAVAGLVTAGCSGGTTTDTSATDSALANGDLTGLTFAFAIPTSAAEVYVNQADTFVQQAEELGATVEVYDNAGDATTMLSNADLMVASDPDVIIEFPSVADATTRVGQKFTDAGIPCIAVNVPVEGCPLFNFDQPYLSGLGATAMAEQMADRGWDASNTTVVIGQASELGASVNIAATAFYAALSELVPGMTPVSSDDIQPTTTVITEGEGLQGDLGLTIDSGYDATLTALQTIPKDRNVVIYTVSDDTTVGVLRALDNQGRTETAMVSGYGGSTDALTNIREGDVWVTEQMGFFAYWGEFLLSMAAATAAGADIPELTSPPMVILEKDNVDTFFEAGTDTLIEMPELPESSTYLYDTGILQKFGNIAGAE